MTKGIILARKQLKKYRNKIKKYSLYLLLLFTILILSSFFINLNIFNPIDFRPTKKIDNSRKYKTKLFFNDNLLDESFKEIISKEINKATNSIEMAIYSFSSLSLKEDIYKANERGVKVTIISSKNKDRQHRIIFNDLPNDIEFISLGSTNPPEYMHHKFIIIDREKENQRLITSSANFTDTQILFDPSYLLLTYDENIIEAFTQEFDFLSKKISGKKKISQANYRPWSRRINYENSFIDIWFSPGFKKFNINEKIIELINSANYDIKIMIWYLTNKDIAKNLINQAIEGKKITIIVDDAHIFSEYSIFPYLLYKKNKFSLDNLEIVSDLWRTVDLFNKIPEDVNNNNFFNPFFHHHALIIDNELLLFGTNNWTNQGANVNDENAIITNKTKLINSYLESFNFHYNNLRNKPIKTTIENNYLLIKNTNSFKENNDLNIIVLGFNDLLVDYPVICYQDKYINNKILIKNDCKNKYLNTYIYNNKGKVYANNLIYYNKTTH